MFIFNAGFATSKHPQILHSIFLPYSVPATAYSILRERINAPEILAIPKGITTGGLQVTATHDFVGARVRRFLTFPGGVVSVAMASYESAKELVAGQILIVREQGDYTTTYDAFAAARTVYHSFKVNIDCTVGDCFDADEMKN